MLHEEKINGENIAIFHTSSQIIVINTKELTYLDMLKAESISSLNEYFPREFECFDLPISEFSI